MNHVEGGHHCDRGETEEEADDWNQPRWRTPTGGSHGREVMVKFPVIPSRLAKIQMFSPLWSTGYGIK